MQANYVQRLRLIFGKDGPARYISHLDLARTLERALNRAQIPVAYTQGFNRRPRLQFASALSLGYTSAGEIADVLLQEAMDPAQAKAQLIARMAPGITIHEVSEVPIDEPSLQAQTQSATYRATPLDPVDGAALRAGVAELLAAAEVTRERKGKPYNLRLLIEDLAVLDGEPVQLEMRLVLRPSGTGRPDEVLAALGFDPLDVHVHRAELQLSPTEA